MRKLIYTIFLLVACSYGPFAFADDAPPPVEQPVVTFDTRPVSELLDEARAIIMNRANAPYDKAIEDLNSIILTQPVALARTAHELLGYAYEKGGQQEKAMREYQRYLSLYPDDSEDRTRVRQRLMALEILVPHKDLRAVQVSKERHVGDSEQFSGAISEYIYLDKNESTQINSLSGGQMSYLREHNEYKISVRVRATELKDFNNRLGNRSTVYNAYADVENTYKGYGVRVGRQPATVGAISRFDGLSARYNITNDVKIEVGSGTAYSGYNSTVSRTFVGTEATWYLNNNWVLGGYYNRGKADGILERSAIGLSANYFTHNSNVLTRVEYDTLYHTVNMMSIQATITARDYNIFAVFEKRKSPMPFLDSALTLGLYDPNKQTPYRTVGELFNTSGLSSADIYRLVGETQDMTTAVVGVTKKVSKKWSLTGDLQSSNLSTLPQIVLTPQFEPIPIQVGQSRSLTADAHLRGEDVIRNNNVIEFVASKTVGAQRSEYITLADSYRFGKRAADNLSLIVRYDRFEQFNNHHKAASAIVRYFHRLNKHDMIETQYSRSVTGQVGGRVTDQTFYVGYRYDW